MFGSIAPFLTSGDNSTDFEAVTHESFFKLLLALEKEMHDDLDILELVDGDKPLAALVSTQ